MLARAVRLPGGTWALSAEAAGFEPARGFVTSTRLAGRRMAIRGSASLSAERVKE